jgi:hypothetical protein
MSYSKPYDRRRRGREGSLLGMVIVLLAVILAGLSLKSYIHERDNPAIDSDTMRGVQL